MLNLFRVDGLSVVKHLQKYPPKNTNKYVIILTNTDKDEEIRVALELGNGYLIKSQITPGSLVEEVKMYLER